MRGGGGGRKKFPLFKRGGSIKFYPVLRVGVGGGGSAKSFGPGAAVCLTYSNRKTKCQNYRKISRN